MFYVLFRPECDSMVDPQRGRPWIDRLRGLMVDDDILPHGGIIFKTIDVSDPNYRTVTDVIVPGIQPGTQDVRPTVHHHTRKVIQKKVGDDGRSPLYVCEATEDDAKYYSQLRAGWWYMMFQRDDQVPRKSQGEVETTETEGALPEPYDKGGRPPDDKYRTELKAKVAAIQEKGGPKIKLSCGNELLEAYISENEGTQDDPNTVATTGVGG